MLECFACVTMYISDPGVPLQGDNTKQLKYVERAS